MEIPERKARDPEFAKVFDEGYEYLKIGVLFRVSREQAGPDTRRGGAEIGNQEIRYLADREPCGRYSAIDPAQIRKGPR